MSKYTHLSEEEQERRREYSRRYRAEHLEQCRANEKRYFEKNKEARLEYHRNEPRERVRARNKRCRDKLKAEIYEHYGDECVCCGEKESKFLSIDHINGDGAEHRRAMGSASNTMFDIRKKGFPEGYQILCFNCNHGRYLNGGTCPHQGR